jgi:hypothetical protein
MEKLSAVSYQLSAISGQLSAHAAVDCLQFTAHSGLVSAVNNLKSPISSGFS